MRQPTRQAAGIHDPLVRQIDHRQRMALMKREIEEVEREVARFRAICEEAHETLRRLDKTDEAGTGR
jgi:TATA-binding protein-associated factor Taf7